VDAVDGQPSYLWINNQPGIKRTILYLHGGGMIIHVPGLYKKWAQRFGPAVNARVLLVDYRLSPEHPYPASNDDCFSAYQWLVQDQGISPDNIVIAGDSAGGYLTLSTLLRIGESELANPACAIALSPLADFSYGSPTMFTNEIADPLLSKQLLPLVRELVLGDHLCTDPLISPVYADLSAYPPLQVHVSSNEILRDDGVRIVDKARAQGVTSELCEWHKTTHVHPIMDGLPESDLAVQRMGIFIDRHCPE
ncbi:MAG: alpha/beta hydrolase, partial [Arenicellales bacterium]